MLKQESHPNTNTEQASKCVHHWVIESRPGQTSIGKCRTCGSLKEFPNHLEEVPWREWTPPARSSLKDVLASVEITRDDVDDTSWNDTSVPSSQVNDLSPSLELEEDGEED